MQTIKLKQRNLNFSIDNLRLLILLFVFILPFISAQSFANGGVGLNATRLVVHSPLIKTLQIRDF